jgi:hypothetical protein
MCNSDRWHDGCFCKAVYLKLRKKNATLKNVITAFAVAPLGGAGVVAAIALVFGVLLAGWGRSAGGVVAMVFVLTAILGYAVGIVAGIPGYLLFRRLGWVCRAHWIALGAALGIVSGAIWPLRVLLLNPDVTHGTAALGALTIAGLLWGAASGLAFAWLIKVEPGEGR